MLLNREFSTDHTSGITGVITALDLHKNILEEGKNILDVGLLEIENEFDELQNAIQNAQGRNAQLSAVRRLADKIECTEDCFVSDDQAAAIIEGLNENDNNIENLINGVRNAAKNRKSNKKKKRSSRTGKEEEEDKLYAKMIDAAIALQNPNFEFTKAMAAKGQSFESLQKILNSGNNESFHLAINQFLIDSNLNVSQGFDAASSVKRNKRAIELAANATRIILQTVKNITRTVKESKAFHDILQNSTTLSRETERNIIADALGEAIGAAISGPLDTLFSSAINGPLKTMFSSLIDPILNNLFDKIAKPIVDNGANILEILLGKFADRISVLDPLLEQLLTPLTSTVDKIFGLAFTGFAPDGHLDPNNPVWFSSSNDV